MTSILIFVALMAPSLLLLWPSVAGRALVGTLCLLIGVWLGDRHLKAAAKAAADDPQLTPAERREQGERHDDAREKIRDFLWGPLIGVAIGLSVICLVEVYLTGCAIWITPLGDRSEGAFCTGESLLLRALMFAREARDPVGHFWELAAVIVLLIVFYPLPLMRRGAGQLAAAAAIAARLGPLREIMVRGAIALVTISLFAFSPVLDGKSLELESIIARFRLEEGLKHTNDRFYATTERQNQLGEELIRQLSGEDSASAAAKQRLSEQVDELYRAIAEGREAARLHLDEKRMNEMIDKMTDGLAPAQRREPAAIPVCGGEYRVCAADLPRLPNVNATLAEQRERETGRARAALKRDVEMMLPLQIAIEHYLEVKHGAELDRDAARITAAIIMTIVANADGTTETLTPALVNATTRAGEQSMRTQAEVAELVCRDLFAALTDFMEKPAGQQLYRKIINSPGDLVGKYPKETGVNLTISDSPILTRVNDYLGPESIVSRRLPGVVSQRQPGVTEAQQTQFDRNAAAMFGRILRAACYQSMAPAMFTQLLNEMAS